VTARPAASLPDFYIVGAPKCGTSALFSYLGAHPGIAMSDVKEPHYWSRDFNPLRPRPPSREAYLDLWTDAPAGALRGEASTHYARSRVAIPAIQAESPDARFILMLRDPFEMAMAWHAQLIFMFEENVASFPKAWRLQEERRQGRRIPPECPDPEVLQYRNVCALGEQLERFVALVKPERRLVLLFDDFVSDTRGQYLKVLSFLGLPDDGRRLFPKVNATQTRRFPLLSQWHRGAGRRLGGLYGPLRAVARRLGLSPSAAIDGFNLRQRPRLGQTPAFERSVRLAFSDEVRKIEAITGRDLGHWRTGEVRPKEARN
jgi:hypothetical protein